MNDHRLFLFPVLWILFFSCGADKEDTSSYATPETPVEKASLAVMAVRLESSPAVVTLRAAGRIEGVRESDIVSETSGEILKVNFEVGDYIEEGDILLTVEDTLPLLSYESARMELRAAELEVEALEKSYKAGGTSLIDFQKKLASMAVLKQKTEEARKTFENTKIRAPYAGYAGNRDNKINPGIVLQAGDTVTHLVDRSSFQIRLTVGEDEIPLIRKGDKAEVFIAALGELRIPARVRAVSPGSLVNGGGFPVWISWENSENGTVKSGMSARVVITTSDRGESSLFIPEEAIQLRQGRSVVFRENNGRAEELEIEYERTVDGRIFLSGGELEEGDRVIVSGFGTLLPGDPVRVTERKGGDAL